jgi:phosphate transport system substrate-binding protein
MGRQATVNEVIGFEWVFRVKPLGIQVINGGLRGEGESPALAVFVSRENPVRQISMAQLAEILGCPADPKRPVTWAMAGAEGAWKNRPVHAFVYDDQTGTGAFLQKAVQGAKDCWNWDVVREFKDEKRGDGSVVPAAQQILDALRHDPQGLAVGTLEYAGPEVKVVPLGGVNLTRASVVEETYPLRRAVYVYLNRAKDKPVDGKVAEFLRFVLSRDGQALVNGAGDYLPLNAMEVAAQRKNLE